MELAFLRQKERKYGEKIELEDDNMSIFEESNATKFNSMCTVSVCT